MKRKTLQKYQDMVNTMLDSDKCHPYYGTIDSLVEEIGEVSKILKPFHLDETSTDERVAINTGEHLIDELGDVLFNLSLLAAKHEILLSDILSYNYTKVKDSQ